jgi:hypothetical protein
MRGPQNMADATYRVFRENDDSLVVEVVRRNGQKRFVGAAMRGTAETPVRAISDPLAF